MVDGDITHQTGEVEMIASQGSKLKNIILVSYNWQNRCVRQQRQIYQIPQATSLEHASDM